MENETEKLCNIFSILIIIIFIWKSLIYTVEHFTAELHSEKRKQTKKKEIGKKEQYRR